MNNDPAFPYGRAFLAEVKETLSKEAQQYGGIAYDGLLGGMNFNRKHFASTRFALLYNPASRKCFINNYFSCLELARQVHDATNSPLKVISANVTKPDLLFGAPFVDVTTGEPAPSVSYPDLAALRQACGKKSVALLTKHCYVLDREGMERYFRHCLALGIYPGYFDGGVSALNSGSSYFSNSRWLEPMRPLWRKYMSLVKELAEAGWEPLPLATVEEAPGAVVERFGNLYYTVRNPGHAAPKAVLKLKSFVGNVVVDELTGRRLEAVVQNGELLTKLPMGMDDVRVISVNTEESLRARAVKKAMRILDARMVTRKYEAERGARLDAWKGTYELVRTGGAYRGAVHHLWKIRPECQPKEFLSYGRAKGGQDWSLGEGRGFEGGSDLHCPRERAQQAVPLCPAPADSLPCGDLRLAIQKRDRQDGERIWRHLPYDYQEWLWQGLYR